MTEYEKQSIELFKQLLKKFDTLNAINRDLIKHPDPKYIQDLINCGRINSNFEVLTSLEDVARFIATKQKINITIYHLMQFKNPQTKKEYSKSAMEKAVTAALG